MLFSNQKYIVLLFSDSTDESVIKTFDQFNQFNGVDWSWINHFVQFFTIEVVERCRDVNDSLPSHEERTVKTPKL